jgi:hypothetical protein
MSFTGKDRKVRSRSGKGFQERPPPGGDEGPFAAIVAAALRRGFGTNPAAVKKVARLTRANERAVKNWFDAKNAPSGELLVRLIQHSDEVLECVLALARRNELLTTKKISDARRELREILTELDRLLA